MAKQIKIGFDKTPSRSVETDQILVDRQGNLLRDEAGNFLYTKTDAELASFYLSRKSMPIVINNEEGQELILGGPISVREQFPEVSEVSTTLLGIPRKNTQQSLLADVSIYGTDPNLWEFYRNPSPYAPPEWIRRFNSTYGNRYYPRLSEVPDQQALAIEAFPVPWTFPWGKKYEDQGRFDEIRFARYAKFVRLGNILYNEYIASGYEVFAKQNFLPPAELGGASFESETGDVIYGEDTDAAMAAIEKWNLAWFKIGRSELENPKSVTGEKLTYAYINTSDFVDEEFSTENTAAGYSSSSYYYAQMQSKEAFRYQPGAISGFTFGIKVSVDETNINNYVEWGCANDTDQYMFRVAGPNLYIVRRSTVAPTEKLLEQNGLEPIVPQASLSPNPFERPGSESITGEPNPTADLPRYETIIDQDNFNGDPLNGKGDSGYTISFDRVTMYKIEYSWYGAIGAKFYAYVPVGHGECRWVLLHTLIIENTLPYPSLRNPFMHFRYVAVIADSSSIRNPITLYKYGASYYIDGSDQGSYTYRNFSSNSKQILNSQSKPIIGFSTKENILNKDGAETPNQKNFYIDKVTASSNKNVRVDVLECEGCKNGFGHFYSTSLVNGSTAAANNYILSEGKTLTFVDGSGFDRSINGKKIIASGIFSSYVYVDDESYDPETDTYGSASIKRRMGSTAVNNPIGENPYSSSVTVLANGVETEIVQESYVINNAKLFGFEDVAAISEPIIKKNAEFLFLNPLKREATGQFNEFRIGVTSKKPEIDPGTGDLLFDGDRIDFSVDKLYVEYAQYQPQRTLNGVEIGEFDPRIGLAMQTDYRIPRPKGSDSGYCSSVKLTIDEIEIEANYSTTSPNPAEGAGNYIVFVSTPSILNLNGGEIGIFDGNRYVVAKDGSDNPVTFISNVKTYIVAGVTTYYVEISDPITLLNSKITFKIISLTGRYVSASQVFKFNALPLYFYVAMHDNARINNIVLKQYDEMSTLTSTPSWLLGNSNIQTVEIGNSNPPSTVIDVIGTNEYLGSDGLFYMGGQSVEGNPPANFQENDRLDASLYDNQINQPLRPGSLKYTFFIGAGETIDMDMQAIFGIDRYKVTKGTFNNKSVYINSRVLDTGESGEISVSVLGKEQ